MYVCMYVTETFHLPKIRQPDFKMADSEAKFEVSRRTLAIKPLVPILWAPCADSV